MKYGGLFVYLGVKYMKKGFALIGAVIIFVFGTIIHYSYITSGGTVWSFLISSVNNSAWETVKPFAIAYIIWIVIELSFLRPSLLHFVCAKIVMLYLFAFMAIIYSLCINMFFISEWSNFILLGGIFLIIVFVQILSYRIYNSKVKLEIFAIPILLALFLFLIMILFFTVYPPPFRVFYGTEFDV